MKVAKHIALAWQTREEGTARIVSTVYGFLNAFQCRLSSLPVLWNGHRRDSWKIKMFENETTDLPPCTLFIIYP
jgi:hypothetical protein